MSKKQQQKKQQKQQQKQQKMVKKPLARSKKKVNKIVSVGMAHVKATFNNTIITITDLSGAVLSWASAGKANFSGSRKSSAFAAMIAAQSVSKDVIHTYGMKECEVNLKGPGAGRESAVKGLQSAGLIITIIRDKTPVPHNGCRPKKRRRV